MELTRRGVLGQTLAVAGVSALAGCLGGDEDESDTSSDDDGGEPTNDGDASLTFDVGTVSAEQSDIDKLDQLTVDLQRALFYDDGGGSAEVRFEEEVDLKNLVDSRETFADSVAFPSGTYTTLEFDFEIVTATANDGSDVTESFDWTSPAEIDLEIVDDYFEVSSGSSRQFNLMIHVTQLRGDWRFGFGHGRY